ncbi:MAG: bifunctional folylpolyglutamate synthase/dihydrofolate synthase [Acidimicrobiales bacterium]|nr:bifunctional folylpolyglutamate synthase/dihydrofolate synthase [Acidimicrobiales bacterium]MYB80726.1 bifunctional folylpolyglutamate synthase/dihydrofolate synthase [Acidimicrobiales bacterium]MYI11599.1 bifunctional folylpolyglutamate synthase/dihydrofolate synthase [Acidimicrobiales bacterium]
MNPGPPDTGPPASAAGPLRDYEAAVDWLDSHIDLERLLGSPEATPPTLDRMWTLMGVLGDPQDSVPAIHITGTNGKGSTARLAVALLGACGLAAGSYTSPHINRVNDRIAVANEPLDDDSFTMAISEVAVFEPMVIERCGERPNYFEVMAAAAYNWFASAAHVNVIEVGMGGRWDATNVVDAAVAVITNVGADHLEIIGPTLADVAQEKAGIISAGATVVCGETAPELTDIVAAAATQADAELWRNGVDWDVLDRRLAVGGQLVTVRTPFGEHADLFVPLHGAHQATNVATAIASVEAFFGRLLDDDVIAAALDGISLPARFEIVARQPTVVIDGAHNPAGAVALRDTLAESLLVDSDGADSARVLVIGANRPHDPAAFCEALGLGQFDAVVATAAHWPRALPPAEIAAAVETVPGADRQTTGRWRPPEIINTATVSEAVQAACERAGSDGIVVVSGSLYVAAEARRLLGVDPH